jgi:hypothetical protein
MSEDPQDYQVNNHIDQLSLAEAVARAGRDIRIGLEVLAEALIQCDDIPDPRPEVWDKLKNQD